MFASLLLRLQGFGSVLTNASEHLGALQHSSPDAAILFATMGLCLIFAELNRPGMILPGALGLLLVLLSIWVLAGYPLELWAVASLMLSACLMLLNLWLKLPVWLLVVATLVLSVSLRFLVPGGTRFQVHAPVALGCGVGIGTSGAFLSRVALRARRAKRVN